MVGTEVIALTRFGGYADIVSVPAGQVFAKPSGLTHEEGVSLPVAYLTAWQLLVVMGSLTPEETVLIHNAGGGVEAQQTAHAEPPTSRARVGGHPAWSGTRHPRSGRRRRLDVRSRTRADVQPPTPTAPGGAVSRYHGGWPPIGPGSWQLGVRSLLRVGRPTPRPRRSAPAGCRAARSPPSRSRARSRRVVPEGLGPHPGLWVVACDYATGRRVAFGRTGSPAAELAEAVAASVRRPRLLHRR